MRKSPPPGATCSSRRRCCRASTIWTPRRARRFWKASSRSSRLQRRFYTAIKQLSGKTGEEAGGYTKATGAANINFAIVQKDALIQYTKHAAPKIIAPENNPDADAYVFGYRMVGIAKAYKNMLSGMYFSHDKA